MHKGVIDEPLMEDIRTDAAEEVRRGVESFESMCVPRPEELFDYTYETMPAELAEQKEEFLAILAAKKKKK